MIQAFNEGQDLHSLTARDVVLGDPNAVVTKKERQDAKAINFGGQTMFQPKRNSLKTGNPRTGNPVLTSPVSVSTNHRPTSGEENQPSLCTRGANGVKIGFRG